MSILAFLTAFVLPTKPITTFDYHNRCQHCVSYDPHTASDHDEAIFRSISMSGGFEP